MAFVRSGNTCQYTSSTLRDSISDGIPLGIWRYRVPGMGSPYLELVEDYDTSHEKVYDTAPEIANHICEAYLNQVNKGSNLGVLLVGKKGSGKSLVARMVIDQLKSVRPVIIVDDYEESFPNFMNYIRDCIVFFDEFEKNYSGDHSGELLSVLDGTGNKTNNLFLLTCNTLYSINDNFFSRPGRIRYLYRMDGVTHNTVREFLTENLTTDDKGTLEYLISRFTSQRWVTIDMLRCAVDEINCFFPNGASVDELDSVFKYLNISRDSGSYYVRIKVMYNANRFEDNHGGYDEPDLYTPDEVDERKSEDPDLFKVRKVIREWTQNINSYTDKVCIYVGASVLGLNLKDAKFNGVDYEISPEKVKVVRIPRYMKDFKIMSVRLTLDEDDEEYNVWQNW